MSDRITIYWRPGCPFCSRLRHGLKRSNLEYTELNIWEDGDAAAFVRSVNHGNEVVPTVVVGDTVLVNPRLRDVVSAASAAENAA